MSVIYVDNNKTKRDCVVFATKHKYDASSTYLYMQPVWKQGDSKAVFPPGAIVVYKHDTTKIAMRNSYNKPVDKNPNGKYPWLDDGKIDYYNVKTYVYAAGKVYTGSKSINGYLPPSVTWFTTSMGTYNKIYDANTTRVSNSASASLETNQAAFIMPTQAYDRMGLLVPDNLLSHQAYFGTIFSTSTACTKPAFTMMLKGTSFTESTAHSETIVFTKSANVASYTGNLLTTSATPIYLFSDTSNYYYWWNVPVKLDASIQVINPPFVFYKSNSAASVDRQAGIWDSWIYFT